MTEHDGDFYLRLQSTVYSTCKHMRNAGPHCRHRDRKTNALIVTVSESPLPLVPLALRLPKEYRPTRSGSTLHGTTFLRRATDRYEIDAMQQRSCQKEAVQADRSCQKIAHTLFYSVMLHTVLRIRTSTRILHELGILCLRGRGLRGCFRMLGFLGSRQGGGSRRRLPHKTRKPPQQVTTTDPP
jgi:hypothetical protein